MTFDVVITTDRSMMTDHHHHEFLGFMTTGPAFGVPEWVWRWIAAPKPKVDSLGRPKVAPYGLRKIEAALVDAGFNAAVVDPDHISKHLDTMKVLMIGHHDFFAYGPPSSEWWTITGREPFNRVSFRRFMESPAVREAKRRGVKIIVGGPAAWQWLWSTDEWKKWGVDTVIDGEADRVVSEVVDRAIKGQELPDYIYVGPYDTPATADEIPKIKHASVNGLVEIMRGCPRGCKFCSVTLRPWRFIPVDDVISEIKVNMSEGEKGIILHSEDVLLYYADGIKPRPEGLLKLHTAVRQLTDEPIGWSHASLAAIKYAEDNYKLISKLTEIMFSSEKQRYLGVEVGLETGSVKLARKVMPAKSAPYPTEKYPEVVEDAFAIMHEHNVIPAATLIIGQPGEEPDDVVATTELVEKLRPYRSLIVPMFFVPMGAFKNMEWFRRNMVRPEHVELLRATLRHSAYWARDIVDRFYLKGTRYFLVRAAVKWIIGYIERKAEEAARAVEQRGA